MTQPIYDHAFTLAFSMRSRDSTGLEIEADAIRQAVIEHLALLSDDDLLAAIDAPFDTYEVEQSLNTNAVAHKGRAAP